MADADGKMRMEKKADGKKNNNNKNKETNKGKKSFFQVAVTWLDPPLTYRT